MLVAIAIPIFSTQLEKSREATDTANIRDYYAEVATALVTGDLDFSKTTQSLTVSGGHAATVSTALTTASGKFNVKVAGVPVKQTVSQWQSGDQDVAGVTVSATTDMVPTSGTTTDVYYQFTVTASSDTAVGSTVLTAVAFGSEPSVS